MKKVLTLLVVVAAVASIYCGPKTEAPKAEKTVVAELPAEALQPLTDEEIVSLTKVLPDVGAALRAGNFQPTESKEDDQIATVIVRFVDEMKPIAGLEGVLTKAGTSWDAFRATMLKIAAAQAAMSADMVGAMIEEMKKDTTAEAKKAVVQMEALRTACAKVPPGNKEMLTKHAKELEALKELAKEPTPGEPAPEEKPAGTK